MTILTSRLWLGTSLILLLAPTIGSLVPTQGRTIVGQQGGRQLKLAPGERFVASRLNRVLFFDEDGIVKIAFTNGEGALNRSSEVILGQAVKTTFGGFALAKVVPPDEIATFAQSVTDRKSGYRVHVIQTWSANRDPGLNAWPGFQYVIYCFREIDGKIEKVLEDRSDNSELVGIWVRDLFSDGTTEIIDKGYENKIVHLTVRTISEGGSIRMVQRVSAGRRLDFDPENGTLFTEGLESMPEGEILNGRVSYRWVIPERQWEPRRLEVLNSDCDCVLRTLEWDRHGHSWRSTAGK